MTGAEPHAVLTRTLWLLVAGPLAGFLWHLVTGLTARARAKAAPRGDFAGMLAIGGCAGSAIVHIAALGRAGRASPGAFFAETLTSGVQAARFEAPLALSLDPLAAAAIALACLMALIAAVVLSSAPAAPVLARPPAPVPPAAGSGSPGGWQAWAWLELALAGAVLSFAADDPATMALGWSLSAVAGAWLAGWIDADAAVRSGTRSAAGLLAFLLGTVLLGWGLRGTWHDDDYALGPDVTGRIHFAQGLLASPAALDALRGRVAPLGIGAGAAIVPSVLTLWLVAAWAMSGAPLRTPAPAPLVSVSYGGTTAWLGPFLLARGAVLFGMAPKVHVLVACVGGAMAVSACAQALGRKNAHPAGAWAPFAAASPGVLAWIALGASDGPLTLNPAAGAVVGGALATASLLLFAVWPGASLVPADGEAVLPRSPIGLWLERTTGRLGGLLLSNERWVIEATGRGVVLLVAVASWAATRTERDLLDPIGNAAADRLLRAVRRLFGVAVFLAILCSPHRALAAPGAWAVASGGRIAVSLPNGDAGPLVLAPSSAGAFEGTFVVRNAGTESLTVSRMALRGDEEDVRSPARVSIRFADGAPTQATIAPGASKNAVVTWIPDRDAHRDAHVRQAFGHVVITSSDETAGEVAMGFRADLPSGLGWIGAHALSFLVLWPFVSALLFVTVSRLSGWSPRSTHTFTLASGAAELAMALWAFGRFAADVGRASGNDGFQLIERSIWARSAGAEWYVGVDGASIALVLLAALVAFAVACLGRPESADGERMLSTALLVSGVVGVLVALDLVLFFAAWCAVWLALVILVGAWGGARSASASAKLTVYALAGTACLLLAFVALSRASGPAFLLDGTRVAHTLSIPELSRTSFATNGTLNGTPNGTILGLPLVHAAWGLLLVAVVMATPLVPLHGWLPDVLEEGPPGAGILVAGAVLPLGPYLLMRVGLGAVPEGARWAGASVAALAAFSALWASLCAFVQTDLRRFAAYAAVAGGAMSLYGIASLTPEGIAGGGLLLFAHGLSSALLMGIATAVTRRIGSGGRRAGPAALAGLGREAPLLAGIGVVALGTSAAVPGLAGGWGVMLVMLGGFVRYPLLAFFLAAALVISVAAHLRFARAMILSTPARDALESEALAPFGGRLPDATSAELVALLPLAFLSVWLGLWPSPIVSSIAVAAHDIGVAVDPTGTDVNAGR